MTAGDLPDVEAISAAVHGRYAEPAAVYADRLALYPGGCHALDMDGGVHGLLVMHPWHRHAPPALGAMLGSLPHDADTLYLHDIALLPGARRLGAGRAALALALDLAAKASLADITLVAVNGADRYWAAQGFTVDPDPLPHGYGTGTVLMRAKLAASTD